VRLPLGLLGPLFYTDLMNIPDFHYIVDNCVKKIIRNYPKKRDSWMTTSDDWFVRMMKKELEGMPEGHIGLDLTEKRKRLTNIINMASMMYHNIGIELE